MKKLLATLLVPSFLVVVLGTATAQPRDADDFYKQGEKHYNLGEFPQAIESFKAAYGLEAKPGYLFNIAQSYRQLGDCKNAVFFYKRFLSLKANDTAKPLNPALKAEIEGRIPELEACAREADAIKNRPPDQIRPDDPDKGGPGKTGPGNTGTGGPGNTGPGGNGTGPDVADGDDDDGDGGDDDDDGDDGDGDGDVGVSTAVYESPTTVAVRAYGGGAKVGAGDLEVPIQFSGALLGGYPLEVAPSFTLELGGGITYTPVPYDLPAGESATASLFSLLANVGATYAISPKIELHADVGLGALMFTGLRMGNPFTEGGAETTGALTMFNLRIAATVGYAVTPNFLIVGTPIAFSYSPPKEGLTESISALTRLDFMLGVGYRM